MRINIQYESDNHNRYRWTENTAWTNGEDVCIAQRRADGPHVEFWLTAEEVTRLRDLLNGKAPDPDSLGVRVTLSERSTDGALQSSC